MQQRWAELQEAGQTALPPVYGKLGDLKEKRTTVLPHPQDYGDW